MITIIHENPAWLPPLAEALDARGLPWRELFADQGPIDFSRAPTAGVYFNRMSASSHTRDHRFAPEFTQALLSYLERYGMRVVNGLRALDHEVSKVRQYSAFERAGVSVPRTVAVVGREHLVDAARQAFAAEPFVLKPNRGGKGLGVTRFDSPDALTSHLESPLYADPIDGVHLLQQYIHPAEPFIIRAEFVGGHFLYAVRVDTSAGFELCPADACAPEAAPVRPKFEIVGGIDPALRARLEQAVQESGAEIAAVEFITDQAGRVFAYDLNTNTNYNPDAERRAGLSGPGAIADFLGSELAKLTQVAA